MRRAPDPARRSRRQLLRVGGTTVAAAALFAACRSGADDDVADGHADRATRADLEILRTASSLDRAAVEIYTTVLDTGLVTTATVETALARFRRHHREHATLFERATADGGGEPFTEPNPVFVQALAPALDSPTDEDSVLAVLAGVELVLAQTYQSVVGGFSNRSYDVAVMSVGGVEIRHAAVLAPLLGQPAAPDAFGPTDDAVAAGTGLGGAP